MNPRKTLNENANASLSGHPPPQGAITPTRLSVSEPIIGMAVLTGRDGNPRIVVGTKFGVQVFGTEIKKIGGISLLSAGIAMPIAPPTTGGK